MITLRLATLEDAPAIQEIAETTWPISYAGVISPEQIRYMLDLMYNQMKITTAIRDPQQAFWLAEENGTVLGFCGIEHGYPEAGFTRIHKLYILPSTQGSGLGKILLDQVEKEARKNGNSKLHLNVNKRNKAVGFYHKQGFTTDREEVIDIGNGYVMDDFVMVKLLN
ncbi:MAG: GCN5-related N-acetyltransferase [Fluviicola sp.]|jgi:ribosomal protein S18 acetylase RimI-like enzyme|uniref:GNAT family N-acetyltransferase n=1 Tax=Fluviicola sp. TaxID=1917219 RepID=UPI002612CB02|nr:GNAT family N-acetyltransferase [Fluviicola sp.]MDF3026126.1 GCN5-related N-acetyltransferase [Fluviicola sp.]